MAQQTKNIRVHQEFLDLWLSRKDVLEDMYGRQRLSQQVIADSYGVVLGTLQHALRVCGIPPRSRGRPGAEHHAFKDGKASVLYRTLVVKTWCERCLTTAKLAIHHRNGDHYDSRPENLAVYCQGCHQSEHKKAWWRAKKAGLPLPKGNGRVGWKPQPRKSNRKSPSKGIWSYTRPEEQERNQP